MCEWVDTTEISMLAHSAGQLSAALQIARKMCAAIAGAPKGCKTRADCGDQVRRFGEGVR